MTLLAPNLDSRTFQQLMDEAKARIPRFTPEWTNFNTSDPGMALVELQAWMTETLLYEFNRVPELNYIKFLDLIGIAPTPAQPARTELSFTLDKLDLPTDPLVVPVPKATKVSVDDPQLSQDLVFETDRALSAINADFGAVISPIGDLKDLSARSRALVTSYDKTSGWLHSFDPFSDPPMPDRYLYIGLVLRPNVGQPLASYLTDQLPAGPLDLYLDATEVYDLAPNGAEIPGPLAHDCATAGKAGAAIEWQIYTGAALAPEYFLEGDQPEVVPARPATTAAPWTTVKVLSDTTRALAVSGHVVLEIPRKATPVNPRALDPDFWTSFGQTKPPLTYADLKEAVPLMAHPEDLGGLWAKMGVPADRVKDLAACKSSAAEILRTLDDITLTAPVHPEALNVADWVKVDPQFDAPLPKAANEFRPFYWLRARLVTLPPDTKIASLRGLQLNTASATQASTEQEVRLGASNARPGQSFLLPKKPVLIDPATGLPDLTLVVGGEAWSLVADFVDSGPDSNHYLLDPGAGLITFGDGLHGRIPLAQAAILVGRYRVGGGRIGNVGPGTITKIKGRVNFVKAASNSRAAHDGADAESLDDVKLRAPRELRHRDRAVSAEDFADIALQTPGVSLHRALALARRKVEGDVLVEQDGSVTLLLLPKNDQPQPQPSEAQFEAVCKWLEPRRLITTELHLIGPTYVDVTELALRIWVRDDFDLPQVNAAVYEALIGFLHPITGGSDGAGWGFGDAIYHSDLYEKVLTVPGVRRAAALSVTVAGGVTGQDDVTPIPEGALPALARENIKLVSSYD